MKFFTTALLLASTALFAQVPKEGAQVKTTPTGGIQSMLPAPKEGAGTVRLKTSTPKPVGAAPAAKKSHKPSVFGLKKEVIKESAAPAAKK